jgi:hypothetical protein
LNFDVESIKKVGKMSVRKIILLVLFILMISGLSSGHPSYGEKGKGCTRNQRCQTKSS